MPEVISNTTPLIALSKISKLELLKTLYGEITIAEAVLEEYQRGKSKAFYQNISAFDWIKTAEVKNKKALEFILELDRGEAESIVVAEEMNAELLIIDELRGREFARLRGLKITGTIGVLLKAKQEYLIESVLPFAYELREKGIWINDMLINYVKEIEQAG